MDPICNFALDAGSAFLSLGTAFGQTVRAALINSSYSVNSLECSPRQALGDEYDRASSIVKDELKLRREVYNAFLHGKAKAAAIPSWLARICADDDLTGNYGLLVVYKKNGLFPFLKSERPILSCRYFCGRDDIKHALGSFRHKWDPQRQRLETLTDPLPDDDETIRAVCIDRLCDRTSKSWNAKVIAHSLAFNRVIRDTNASVVYAIARQRPKEEYLRNYLAAGMEIVGTTSKQIGGVGRNFKFWIMRGEIARMREFAFALGNFQTVGFRRLRQA